MIGGSNVLIVLSSYRLIALSLCLNILACGDQVDTPTQDTSQQSIIFGDDITLQHAYEAYVYAGDISVSSSERQRRWLAANMAASSPLLTVETCIDETICDLAACGSAVEESFGAANLTSVTQIVSAQHVLASSTSVKANFNREQVVDAQNTSEEWTLPKRLFSLGLHREARSDVADLFGRDRRDEMREWGYKSNRSFYTHDQIYTRDVASAVPAEIQSLDAVALRYQFDVDNCTQCEGPNDWCDSANKQCFQRVFGFQQAVFGPGPLFNVFALEPNLDKATSDEVFAVANNNLPERYFPIPLSAQMTTEPTGVVSYDANQDGSYPCKVNFDLCAPASQGGAIISAPSDFKHCVQTSLDVNVGWSGGPVVSELRVQDEGDRWRQWGVTKAILAFIPDDTQANWYDESITTPSNYPTGEFVTTATLIDGGIATESRRDYDYTLPPTEDPDGLLSQLSDYRDGYYQPGDLLPEGCDPAVKCSNIENTQGEGVGLGSGDLIEYSCRDAFYPATQLQDVRVANGYMVGWMGESTASPLQHEGPGDDQDYLESLGTLYGVCAPWSEASYFLNWTGLRFVGLKRQGNQILHAALEYDHFYFGTNLARALPSIFEVAKQEWLPGFELLDSEANQSLEVPNPIDLLRPPSMQFCPPGSAVRGLGLQVRHCAPSDGCSNYDPSPDSCGIVDGERCGPGDSFVCIDHVCQQPLIKSVVRLECAALDDNPGYNEQFSVPTTTDALPGRYDFQHGRTGRTMPLDNYIGNSYEGYFAMGPTDQIDMRIECDEAGYLVGGFQVSSESTSHVTALGLTCIPGPQ